jgi:hypothetical protein
MCITANDLMDDDTAAASAAAVAAVMHLQEEEAQLNVDRAYAAKAAAQRVRDLEQEADAQAKAAGETAYLTYKVDELLKLCISHNAQLSPADCRSQIAQMFALFQAQYPSLT